MSNERSGKRKPRVVLDTNVIISALIFGGTPRQVTDMVAERIFRPVVCAEIMTELRRVITGKFPARAEPELQIFERLMKRYAIWVKLGLASSPVSRDPDDDKFLETAILGACDYIVSGDQDLLSLGNYEGVAIVTPAGFLEIMSEHQP